MKDLLWILLLLFLCGLYGCKENSLRPVNPQSGHAAKTDSSTEPKARSLEGLWEMNDGEKMRKFLGIPRQQLYYCISINKKMDIGKIYFLNVKEPFLVGIIKLRNGNYEMVYNSKKRLFAIHEDIEFQNLDMDFDDTKHVQDGVLRYNSEYPNNENGINKYFEWVKRYTEIDDGGSGKQ